MLSLSPLCRRAAAPLLMLTLSLSMAASAAPLVSRLTGVSLPAGARAERGFLAMAAAKVDLDLAAKRFGVQLGDAVEMYRLPPTEAADAAASMLALLREQGWQVNVPGAATDGGVIQKGAQRFVIQFSVDRREAWVYFAPMVGAPSTPPAPAAPLPPPPVAAAAAPRPAATPPTSSPNSLPNAATNAALPPAAARGWAYTTTRFDDGWVAVEDRDWVRAARGLITVLVHHAQFDMRSFINKDGTVFVWNTLVAPRYRDIGGFFNRPGFWTDGGFMDGKDVAWADATEVASGRRMHVVLFRGGNGRRWIEIQAPDKATFEREVTPIQVQDGTNWPALLNLANVNKFAVGAHDLVGLWTSSDAAGVQYVNAYTGNSMGMAAASSTNAYTFRSDSSYTSVWKGVDGMVGQQRFTGVTYNGRYTVAPWKLTLTNRHQGATHVFDVQFEAVQGGRALHVRRGEIESFTLIRASN